MNNDDLMSGVLSDESLTVTDGRSGLLDRVSPVGDSALLQSKNPLASSTKLSRSQALRRSILLTEAKREREERRIMLLEKEREAANSSSAVFVTRWVNMFCASVVGAIFFFYPIVVQTASRILRCSDLDLGSGTVISVVQSEPSIRCDSPEYDRARTFAWTVLIGFGMGAPIIIFVLIRLLTRYTCGNSARIARKIFFFTTGCYREDFGCWKHFRCVSGTRAWCQFLQTFKCNCSGACGFCSPPWSPM